MTIPLTDTFSNTTVIEALNNAINAVPGGSAVGAPPWRALLVLGYERLRKLATVKGKEAPWSLQPTQF